MNNDSAYLRGLLSGLTELNTVENLEQGLSGRGNVVKKWSGVENS